jgi:hypothetical protein
MNHTCTTWTVGHAVRETIRQTLQSYSVPSVTWNGTGKHKVRP